tara:strand:+ start:242 stop:511 length:270 start_codon:yes stop_codon:yes gene_type:complete
MTYTGIKITNTTSPAATLNFIKISNGQYDVDTMAASGDMDMQTGSPAADVMLTSVTIDTAANTISGCDAAGNRYIVDKAGSVSVSLVST